MNTEDTYGQRIAELEAQLRVAKEVIEDLSDHGSAAERMEVLKTQQAEIEQLKRDNAFYGSNDYVHSLKVLLTRAADALDNLSRCFLVEDATVDWELIAELRKAAQ